jgi:hypothetical protein
MALALIDTERKTLTYGKNRKDFCAWDGRSGIGLKPNTLRASGSYPASMTMENQR